MVLYFFKDTINKEWQSFTFYDSKWRESSIKLNKRQLSYVKKQRMSKKFGYPVYVVENYKSLSKFGKLKYRKGNYYTSNN